MPSGRQAPQQSANQDCHLVLGPWCDGQSLFSKTWVALALPPERGDPPHVDPNPTYPPLCPLHSQGRPSPRLAVNGLGFCPPHLCGSCVWSELSAKPETPVGRASLTHQARPSSLGWEGLLATAWCLCGSGSPQGAPGVLSCPSPLSLPGRQP